MALSVVTAIVKPFVPPSPLVTWKSMFVPKSSPTVTALVAKTTVGGFCAQAGAPVNSTMPAARRSAGSPLAGDRGRFVCWAKPSMVFLFRMGVGLQG